MRYLTMLLVTGCSLAPSPALSQDFFWDRTDVASGAACGGWAWVEAWDDPCPADCPDPMEPCGPEPILLQDSTSDTTGPSTPVQSAELATAQLSVGAAAGLGDAEIIQQASLQFNPSGQSVTNFSGMTQWAITARLHVWDEFAYATGSCSLTARASHTLSSNVHSNGTPVLAGLKILCGWQWSGASNWGWCDSCVSEDWFISAFKGGVSVSTDMGPVCISYFDPELGEMGEFVEICSAADACDMSGSNYVDIEDTLEVGQVVNWTGNVAAFGTHTQGSYGDLTGDEDCLTPDDLMCNGQANILLEMFLDEEPAS